MFEIITPLFSYTAVLSHVVLIVLVAAVFSRNTWGRSVFEFLGRNSVLIGLVITAGAVLGSLAYSNIVGFEPCVLCWWQRVFLFPAAILFLVAYINKDRDVFKYIVPLVIIAGLIALYHSYTQLGGTSLLPCTAAGGSCSKVFVKEFGYITIPTMSLTVIVYTLFIAWVQKLYKPI